MSETAKKHKAQAPAMLRFAVFTCSTSRYHQSQKGKKVDDISGDIIEELLRDAGHNVVLRNLISDDSVLIRKSLKETLASPDLDAVVFCGGTGIAPSDVTIETVSPFLEKTLPGFGEIFRRLSFDKVGSPAVLSRTVAGVASGKAIFCLPGSPNAVRLYVKKLILPETAHVVKHARE